LDIVFQHEYCDSKGRLIMLNVQIKDENCFLINLYGPIKDAEAVRFYQDLSTPLRGVDLDSDSNVIVGGDFNCPLDPTLDKKRRYSNSSTTCDKFNLHDIWRIKNPNTLSYTWSKSSPFISCRLDYWLISDNLNDLVTQVDIVASIKTDHSSIILELEDIKDSRKGPGFWKLNTYLLNRPDYLDVIKSELPNWLDDAKDLTDNSAKWDWRKFKIKTSSITYSKK